MEEAKKSVLNRATELQINQTFAQQLSENFIDPQFLYNFSYVSECMGLTKEDLVKHFLKNKKHLWLQRPDFKYKISENTYINGKIDNNISLSLDTIMCLCAHINTERSKQSIEYCRETRKYLFTTAEKCNLPGLNMGHVILYT